MAHFPTFDMATKVSDKRANKGNKVVGVKRPHSAPPAPAAPVQKRAPDVVPAAADDDTQVAPYPAELCPVRLLDFDSLPMPRTVHCVLTGDTPVSAVDGHTEQRPLVHLGRVIPVGTLLHLKDGAEDRVVDKQKRFSRWRMLFEFKGFLKVNSNEVTFLRALGEGPDPPSVAPDDAARFALGILAGTRANSRFLFARPLGVDASGEPVDLFYRKGDHALPPGSPALRYVLAEDLLMFEEGGRRFYRNMFALVAMQVRRAALRHTCPAARSLRRFAVLAARQRALSRRQQRVPCPAGCRSPAPRDRPCLP